MKRLLIATNNEHKLKEIRDILGDMCEEILSYKDLKLDVNPEETGQTFEENAIIKAKAGMLKSGLPTLADDSGICAVALNNAPGVYSARFAGESATDQQNNQKLCEYLQKFEYSERKVYYACSIALALPKGGVLTSFGQCDGMFVLDPVGSNGFGYDPHFYLPDYKQTIAQLPTDVKNKISHRYKALCAMKEQMQNYNL